MNEFDTIDEIIKHVRGRFPHLIYVGREYTIADLCRDLLKIDIKNASTDDDDHGQETLSE
jgi:hypothetical protein